MSKENKIHPETYDQLLDNQKQLTQYLYYIRHKKPLPKIAIDHTILQDKIQSKQSKFVSTKVNTQVGPYVHSYIKLLRQVIGLQNYATKKIFKKILQFLEEFPTMNFLYQVINSFGKNQKKLSLNEYMILSQATDQMIPLFQKIIEKIESLKKEFQSKKLLELGHRIQHLQDLVKGSKNIINNDSQLKKIFKTYEVDRVEKYLIMQENIVKAEKKFGNFSTNFVKNREVFSNLNQVYLQIKNHDR